MKKNEIYSLIIRYLLLLLLGLFNLKVIYTVFTPLTVYLSYYIISLFDNTARLVNNTISLSNIDIVIISACVGGAAYYLLLILNLSTSMEIKKRVYSLLFLILSFFILNLVRISILSYLTLQGLSFMNSIHVISWHFGSTIMLIIIWLVNIKIFKIRTIPIYSDYMKIYREIKEKNRN